MNSETFIQSGCRYSYHAQVPREVHSHMYFAAKKKKFSPFSSLSLFPHRFVSVYLLHTISLSLYIPKHRSLLKLNINIYILFFLGGNSQLSADLIFCQKRRRCVCLFMFNNLNGLFSLYLLFPDRVQII